MPKGYKRIGGAGLLSILVVVLASSAIDAFAPILQLTIDSRTSCVISTSSRSSLTELYMGKGFNSAKSKQAELAKKMATAKKQGDGSDSDGGVGEEQPQTDYERKLEEDRARFAQMFSDSKMSNPNPYEKGDETGNRPMRVQPAPRIAASRVGALKGQKTSAKVTKRKKNKSAATKKGEEGDINAPLQEGDIARRGDFETLLCCDSGSLVGPIDAARLVPWVPPFVADYIVILADPRAQSTDLRRTVQYLTSNLAPDILKQTIAISSDEVVETNGWIRRAEIDTPMRIFSDRNWAWMQRYSAVGSDGRWSMSITVIDNSGVIQNVVRDVDPSKASQLVTTAVEAIKKY